MQQILAIFNSIGKFFKTAFETIWQVLCRFFNQAVWYLNMNVWRPLLRTIAQLRLDNYWASIEHRFAYNTWSKVCSRVMNTAMYGKGPIQTVFVIITIAIGIAFLACGGGLIGAVIGTVLVLTVIFYILGTIVWLWENLLQPMFPLVMTLLAILGLIIGAFVSIRNYIQSIKAHADPWDGYQDKGHLVEENALRRGYFFGPGRHQAASIFRDAWNNNFSSIQNAVQKRVTAYGNIIIRAILAPFVWIYLLFYIASVLTFGSALTLLIGLIHFVILTLFMIINGTIFALVWLIDRIYLVLRGIRAVCPHCKETYRIPEFACSCGRHHKKLTPSTYGIFYRRCKCGNRLPTTFFNGRSKLEAYCPKCGETLVSTDTRPFGITLVGASSAGKTAVLTSFFHVFQEFLKTETEIQCVIPDIQRRKFDMLNRYYTGAQSLSATVVDEVTEMYSLILKLPHSGGKIQFSVYDVAGEVFKSPDLGAITYANDMAISQGVIFTLDPLSAPALRDSARVSDRASKQEMSEVLNNFVNFIHTLPNAERVSQKINRPVAILITKMDSPTVKEYISLKEIRKTVNAAKNGMQMQDMLCRDFLMEIGMGSFLTALDAQFGNVHFFPVSATGGVSRGIEFKPKVGLEDPFYWIISRTDKGLADAMDI